MKKRNLTLLTLQKSTVSNFNQKKQASIVGGSREDTCKPSLDPADLSCFCTLKCSLGGPAICPPDPTGQTCPTTCSPQSCYAC